MNIITFNKNNIIDKYYNNRLSYVLNKDLEPDKYKISLFSFSIPYSIPNISSTYNNNTFQIVYNNITYNYTIDEGFYNIISLNNYFKYVQKNTAALPYNIINTVDTFFFEITENNTYYSTQLTLKKTVLTGTAGNIGAVYNGNTFQINFNSNLSEFLGFKKDILYPPNITNIDYTRLSKDDELIPNLTPVFSLNFGVNVITNELSANTTNIYSYTPLGIVYGSLMYNVINPPIFFKTSARTNKIEINIYDQNGNKIKFLDGNMTINLLIEPI